MTPVRFVLALAALVVAAAFGGFAVAVHQTSDYLERVDR